MVLFTFSQIGPDRAANRSRIFFKWIIYLQIKVPMILVLLFIKDLCFNLIPNQQLNVFNEIIQARRSKHKDM